MKHVLLFLFCAMLPTAWLLGQGTPAAPGDVVINKIMNKGTSSSDNVGDAVELLVVSDHVDLRGCFIKDFSSDATLDEGGKFRFNTFSPLLSDLRAGTLIWLTNGDPATVDSTYNIEEGDWLIQVSMPNSTGSTGIFPSSGNIDAGEFRIGNDEIVMLMTADANGVGVSPFVHAFIVGNVFDGGAIIEGIRTYLGGGNPGDTLRSINEIIPAIPGNIAYATNPTTSSDDFNGDETAVAAEGTTIDSEALAFGNGSNSTNRDFIQALRDAVLTILPGFATQGTIQLTAYPNPVRLGTEMTVKFALASADRVRLDLVDLSGRTIYALSPETFLSAGEHALRVAAPTAMEGNSGVFLVRLTAQNAGNQGFAKLALYR